MNRRHRWLSRPVLFALLSLVALQAAADPPLKPVGRFVDADGTRLSLLLRETADGTIQGNLDEDDYSMTLNARRTADSLHGTLGAGTDTVPFTARLLADRLVLEVDGDVILFVPVNATAPGLRPQERPSATGRRVSFNGRPYSDEELAVLEHTYGIRVPDAPYWYDPELGAWGTQGSPVLGFIQPGLSLGGPLQPNASGGQTAVFVNGRALHPWDLQQLQQLTGPIQPGRYFLTAQGIAGYEGGPPLWNLLISQAGAGGDPTGNWQSRLTGASGFSDGTTSAVFLPNGGIVSTGD